MKILKLIAFPFVFLFLKLFEIITWKPIWQVLGFIAVLVIIAAILTIIIGIVSIFLGVLLSSIIPIYWIMEPNLFGFPEPSDFNKLGAVGIFAIGFITVVIYLLATSYYWDDVIDWIRDNIEKTKTILKI